MTASVTPKYTLPPARPQAKPIQDDAKGEGFASLAEILDYARRTGKAFNVDFGVVGPFSSDTIEVEFEGVDPRTERRLRRAEEKRQRRMRRRRP